MMMRSLALATAIVIGTFCAAHAAGNAAVAATKFVKTEISCLTGITCAVRIVLPTNKLITLKGFSCVDIANTVTRADLRIIATNNRVDAFVIPLLLPLINEAMFIEMTVPVFHFAPVIDTKAHELWLNFEGTVAGEKAATCYSAY